MVLLFDVFGLYVYYMCLQSLNPPVLIFVQSKERAKELYGELALDNIRASVIHSDLSQIQVILFHLLFY